MTSQDTGEPIFRFGFRLNYADIVEEKLYNIETHGLTIEHHVLQRRSETILCCLQCGVNINYPTTRKYMEDHFSGHNLSEDQLDSFNAYHKAFLDLPEEYQMQQVFYIPVQPNRADCTVCNRSIAYQNIEAHTRGARHDKAVQKYKSGNFVRVGISQVITKKKNDRIENTEELGRYKEEELVMNIKEMNIDKQGKNKQKGWKPPKNVMIAPVGYMGVEGNNKEAVNQELSNFKHVCSNLTACLLCSKVLGPYTSFEQHLTGLQHKEYVMKLKHSVKMREILGNYHNIWATMLHAYSASYKKYYITHTKNLLKCLLCLESVPFEDAEQHIKAFPCSFVDPNDLIYDNSVNWIQHWDAFIKMESPQCYYAHAITIQVYTPVDFFNKLFIDEGLNAHTMQRRCIDDLQFVYCLLCNVSICSLKDDKYIDHVAQHMIQRAHVKQKHSKPKLVALYAYHNYFLKAAPETALLQVRVNIHRKGLVTCMLCDQKFCLEYGINCMCTRSQQRVDPGGVGEKTEKSESFSPNTSVIAPSTLKGQTKNPQLQMDVVPLQDEVLCYDDETLCQLYSTCNTPRGQRRPEILTVQKRSEHEKYCLACACSIYVRGVDHISSEKHTSILQKKKNILKAYHDFWMRQKPDKQLLQIYYNPVSDTLMTCVGCWRDVQFYEPLHKKCIQWVKERASASFVPDEFTSFELIYEKEIVRRFFYGVQYDLSRDTLGTDLPVAYVYKKYFTCLMCHNRRNVRMVRNVQQWRSHLAKYHCKPGVARDNTLRRVVDFHAYWARQTLDRQRYLCYFTLSRNGVCCDLGHNMPLEEAVQHVETESLCKLLQLIETEKENREKMQLQENNVDENDDTLKHKVMPVYGEPLDEAIVQLPIYMQHHVAYFSQIQNNSVKVQCALCKNIIANTNKDVRHHVATEKHLKKSSKNSKKKYYCDVCYVDTCKKEMQWIDHLGAEKHLALVKEMPEERRVNMSERYCQKCRQVFFGDEISEIRHEANGLRDTRKKPNVMTDGMKQLLSSRRVIEEKAREIVNKCARFRELSKLKVEQCISDLEQLIKTSFPNCKIYQFGSRVSEFVVEDSDLDLFVDVDNKYYGNEFDYHAERRIVQEVSRLLQANRKTYIDIHTVLSARVPIAKVVHAPTELDCDLSFVNGLSVENTKLVKFYADIQPKFGEAMLVLKEWGLRMVYKLKNTMTSYALSMILIFNMQLDGYLPSVDHIRSVSTYDVPNINGWDIVDYEKINKEELVATLKQPSSVADVVQSFFRYYGAGITFSEEVVCPLLGRTISVRLFDNKGEETPDEMHTYRNKVAEDPDAQFKVRSHMFVQDPFDLGHNLIKMANKDFVRNFKSLCRASLEHIKN